MFTNEQIKMMTPHDFSGRRKKLYLGRRFTLDNAYIDEYVTYVWTDESSELIVRNMKKIVEVLER